MGRKDRPGQDAIASGHGGLDFEVCLDVGEEANDWDVSEVGVLLDLEDRFNRLATGGVQVNDEEGRFFCQSPGDHLILASRKQEGNAEMFRRLGNLADEEEVVYCNQHTLAHCRDAQLPSRLLSSASLVT